jgi:tripartite-type tricarboxylate transporter receptor subunit TctC
VPKGTPEEAVARLHEGMVKALAFDDVRAALRDQGANPEGSTPQRFGAFVREEVAKSDRIVAAAAIQLE